MTCKFFYRNLKNMLFRTFFIIICSYIFDSQLLMCINSESFSYFIDNDYTKHILISIKKEPSFLKNHFDYFRSKDLISWWLCCHCMRKLIKGVIKYDSSCSASCDENKSCTLKSIFHCVVVARKTGIVTILSFIIVLMTDHAC